jgi:hypothetical protein
MATTRTTTRPRSGGAAQAKAGAQLTTDATGEGAGAEVKAEARVPLSEVRKPLYASVGAADLAVEKLPALPSTTTAEVKKLSDRMTALPARMPNQLGSAVRAIPGAVTGQLSELQGRATQIYNEFADRGEQRVANIRRSPATREAVNRTRTAVRETRAARTSARKAADAAGRAVSEAATPG